MIGKRNAAKRVQVRPHRGLPKHHRAGRTSATHTPGCARRLHRGCCSPGPSLAGDELGAGDVLRANLLGFAGGCGLDALGEDVPHLVVRLPV